MSAERWNSLYREYRGNPLADGELWFGLGVVALLVLLHLAGIRWWEASGFKSRPAYWLAVSWKLIPLVLLGWAFVAVPALLELPGWLLSRRALPTRTLDKREVPVVPDEEALAYFMARGEPAAWKVKGAPAAFAATSRGKRTDLRCAECGALWTAQSENGGECFACRARGKGVLAVFIPR